ncbi:hypothetical protein K227x_22420 [Rubripirellula lacrimiformis]|uniref:Uncharacterized protein n=2 Tax=Rubripirellula lacrimiformis TaxID=1930273 RepID=A0A517N9N9_9BACT|nr:hypothetical protein K227x_22420 [Rubripirellula lacrimiformis]
MTSKANIDDNDLAGRPTPAGIWLRTKPLPWYARYAGPGSVPVFILLAAAATYRCLRPAKRTETETLLNYSGPLHCARNRDHIVFSSPHKKTGQWTHVLRRFPLSELLSCDYEQSHSNAVKFHFESGECLTLEFEGDWNDLAKFIPPAGSAAKPWKNRG